MKNKKALCHIHKSLFQNSNQYYSTQNTFETLQREYLMAGHPFYPVEQLTFRENQPAIGSEQTYFQIEAWQFHLSPKLLIEPSKSPQA